LPPVRAPAGKIAAPMFPDGIGWLNVATLRMDKQIGRPVLVEFFDVCRVSSLRTLPYVKAWAAKYPDLRVISVHSPGYPPSQDEAVVRAAVERLGIEHAVALDPRMAIWQLYGNEGWPGRYLWDKRLHLLEIHYGEGAYQETEQAIQELLGVEEDLVEPLRPEDDPSAMLVVPTPEQEGAYSGPYEAGAVWAVLEGAGTIRVNGGEYDVAYTGAHELVEHGVHTEGVLELEVGAGVTCHATAFTPGLAP
jgi:mannose-6-phosphate isomerase-like protein (cupin superfamily)